MQRSIAHEECTAGTGSFQGTEPVEHMTALIRIPTAVDAWLGELEGRRLVVDPMTEAIRLAEDALPLNVGGPFGAIVCDPEGVVVGAGVNLVLATGNPLLHAETTAIHRAIRNLGSNSLAELRATSVYSSAQPCAMCLGAIHWAGPMQLVFAATRDDVESIGFREGPVPKTWERQLKEAGVRVSNSRFRERARATLDRYRNGGGSTY